MQHWAKTSQLVEMELSNHDQNSLSQYLILEIIFNHIILWNRLNYFSTLYFALKKMIKLTFGQESSLSDWAIEKSY